MKVKVISVHDEFQPQPTFVCERESITTDNFQLTFTLISTVVKDSEGEEVVKN